MGKGNSQSTLGSQEPRPTAALQFALPRGAKQPLPLVATRSRPQRVPREARRAVDWSRRSARKSRQNRRLAIKRRQNTTRPDALFRLSAPNGGGFPPSAARRLAAFAASSRGGGLRNISRRRAIFQTTRRDDSYLQPPSKGRGGLLEPPPVGRLCPGARRPRRLTNIRRRPL